mgnify:CR=1 FL=1
MYFDKQREMGIKEKDLKYPKLDQVTDADSSEYLAQNIKLKDGKLADIAPTMIDLLGLDIPKEMTGKSLIK